MLFVSIFQFLNIIRDHVWNGETFSLKTLQSLKNRRLYEAPTSNSMDTAMNAEALSGFVPKGRTGWLLEACS